MPAEERDKTEPGRETQGPRRCRVGPWIFAAVVVVLLALEIAARVVFSLLPPQPADDVALLYRPHPYRVYMLVPGARSVRGNISINSQGFRGREIAPKKPPATIRIACLGGSTTFNNTATTDSHTYPALMERFLRDHYSAQAGGGPRIEVINAGVPGYTSLESLIYFESKLLDYDLDVAVFHHGLNDAVFMTYFRDFASDYTHARKVFFVPPPHLWEHSAFLSLIFPGHRSVGNPYRKNQRGELAQLTLTDPSRLGVSEEEQRRCFKVERIDIFARNVCNFIYVARGQGVEPVLSTVACNPKAGFFAEVVGMINDRIREIARAKSVVLVDFAREMPWNSKAFVDKCHLRDDAEGLERKGKIFARRLIESGLIDRIIEKRGSEGGRR